MQVEKLGKDEEIVWLISDASVPAAEWREQLQEAEPLPNREKNVAAVYQWIGVGQEVKQDVEEGGRQYDEEEGK